ncbi:MAG: OsmC family protein [Acetobacteraceae bacterium]
MRIIVETFWTPSLQQGRIRNPDPDAPFEAVQPAQAGRSEAGTNERSPERLLLAAISSSYAITLSRILSAALLPQSLIDVQAEGVLLADEEGPRLTRVTVSPVLHGADCSRPDRYTRAATAARDLSPIGRYVRGNVAYLVGPVAILGAAA